MAQILMICIKSPARTFSILCESPILRPKELHSPQKIMPATYSRNEKASKGNPNYMQRFYQKHAGVFEITCRGNNVRRKPESEETQNMIVMNADTWNLI